MGVKYGVMESPPKLIAESFSWLRDGSCYVTLCARASKQSERVKTTFNYVVQWSTEQVCVYVIEMVGDPIILCFLKDTSHEKASK